MDLILASTSPYRRALLERLGLPFRVVAPGVDEEPFKAIGNPPQALAAFLADQKCFRVMNDNRQSIVIASDQVAELDGDVLSKPGTPERAIDQLTRLRGREHRLHTALVVGTWRDGQAHIAQVSVKTTLAMRGLTEAEIRRYVEVDRPVDCAGSYKIESLGISLFRRIDSSDHTAIIGLPLMQLCGLLRHFGVPVP